MPASAKTKSRSAKTDDQLRARIEAAERRLDEILSTSPHGFVAIDRNWNILFANYQAAVMSQKPLDEFVGKSVWEVWPNTVGSDVERYYRRVMETRAPAHFEFFVPEDGTYFELNVHATQDGIGVHFLDTTQRTNAEKILQELQCETEHRRLELETIYRNAPIGLALFDPVEFRYLSLNDRQAEIVGLPIAEILGRTVTEIAPIEGLNEMFQQVANGHPIVNALLEGELPARPGAHRYWTVNYSPVYGPDGIVRAITAASLEITAQKRAETALIESEKLAAVGRLASSISHEINNPLEAVTNLLYLARSHEQLPVEVVEYLRTAQSELARVSQMATQSLRFYRQSVNPTCVGAADLMNSVVDLYQGRLMNSNIRTETYYTSTRRVLCLENEIRQVLNNLIANAIDAMRQGGRLLLRTHDATDHATGRTGVRLTVADTGSGMSLEARARLFEAFYTTKGLQGTGLGLWISDEIVKRHHGRFAVRSSQQPCRSGTVITLFLPIDPDSTKPSNVNPADPIFSRSQL